MNETKPEDLNIFFLFIFKLNKLYKYNIQKNIHSKQKKNHSSKYSDQNSQTIEARTPYSLT